MASAISPCSASSLPSPSESNFQAVTAIFTMSLLTSQAASRASVLVLAVVVPATSVILDMCQRKDDAADGCTQAFTDRPQPDMAKKCREGKNCESNRTADKGSPVLVLPAANTQRDNADGQNDEHHGNMEAAFIQNGQIQDWQSRHGEGHKQTVHQTGAGEQYGSRIQQFQVFSEDQRFHGMALYHKSCGISRRIQALSNLNTNESRFTLQWRRIPPLEKMNGRN